MHTGGGLKMQFSFRNALTVVCIGIAFFLVRTFCVQLLPAFSYNDFIHLLNLPVGIGLLATIIYGWIAILGIILGWIFCHVFGSEYTFLECLYFGFISGFTSYISVLIWQWCFCINNAFEGLTSRLLVYLALIFAVISTFFRSIYIGSIDPLESFPLIFLISIIGDLMGAFANLYAIKGGMYLYKQLVKK
jgi:hypothetical protein